MWSVYGSGTLWLLSRRQYDRINQYAMCLHSSDKDFMIMPGAKEEVRWHYRATKTNTLVCVNPSENYKTSMLSFNFVSVTTKQLAQPGDRQHAKRTPNLRTGLKGKGLYSQIKPEFIKQSSESLETRTKRIQPVGPRTPLPEPLTSCVNSANKQEMRNRRNKTQKGQKVTKLSEKRDLPPNSTRSVFGSVFGSMFGPCSVHHGSTVFSSAGSSYLLCCSSGRLPLFLEIRHRNIIKTSG